MIESVLEKVKQMLAGPETAGVLALREEEGAVLPHVFTSGAELSRLVTEPKWLLAKTAWTISRSLPEGKTLGVVCRGCDIRAVEELLKAGQIKPGALSLIGIRCSAEQAGSCMCETPYPPDDAVSSGVDPASLPAFQDLCLGPGRLDAWAEHFARCIKCQGCRNACPACVCPTCKLEDEDYVAKGMLPPDPLAFHLVRAIHVADRCVGCGACQDSCPSGLPLLTLHLAVRSALRGRTGYVSGTGELSPLLGAGREDEAAWEDTLGSARPGGRI